MAFFRPSYWKNSPIDPGHPRPATESTSRLFERGLTVRCRRRMMAGPLSGTVGRGCFRWHRSGAPQMIEDDAVTSWIFLSDGSSLMGGHRPRPCATALPSRRGARGLPVPSLVDGLAIAAHTHFPTWLRRADVYSFGSRSSLARPHNARHCRPYRRCRCIRQFMRQLPAGHGHRRCSS